jgi:hypothetical protein
MNENETFEEYQERLRKESLARIMARTDNVRVRAAISFMTETYGEPYPDRVPMNEKIQYWL